jgi:hypothetical protein
VANQPTLDEIAAIEWVLRLLHPLPEAALSEAVQRLSVTDWEAILQAAREHRLAPLLAHRLQATTLPLPASINASLQQAFDWSRIRTAWLYAHLAPVLQALAAEGIPVILLKGVYLGAAIYPHPALRQMSDVDFLVPVGALGRAMQPLRQLGYAEENGFELADGHGIDQQRQYLHHLPPFSKPDGPTLEVHWTLFAPRCALALAQEDMAQVWQRAQPMTVAGQACLALAPEDALLHLCCHMIIQHHVSAAGLVACFDLAELVRVTQPDWQSVVDRAGHWGIAPPVYLALHLAQNLAGAAIPAHVLSALQSEPLPPAVIASAHAAIFHTYTYSMRNLEFTQLVTRGSAGCKLRRLLRALFPSPQDLAHMYPALAASGCVYRLYPRRWADVRRRHAPALWALWRGDETGQSVAQAQAVLADWLHEQNWSGG